MLMKSGHATIVGIIVLAGMVAGIMYGVKTDNAAIPPAAFLAGAFLLLLIKRSVSTVIEDEFTRLVEQKAATMTLNVTSFAFTVIGLILITISGPGNDYYMAVYAIAAMLITISALYAATSIWYSRHLRAGSP